MQTVKDITEAFSHIAGEHAQINSFRTSSFDEIAAEKLGVANYPMLYAQCTSAELNSGYTEFDFDVIIASYLIEEKHEKNDGMTEIYSQLLLVLQDVIAAFSLSASGATGSADASWGLDLPITCEPFTARFTDLLTGWSATFRIRIPNSINLCDAPL